jgi:F-type H+-transporting ATPase subunit epsilon
MKLEIVTPDRKVLSEDVDYVGAPGIMGEFGVLPKHVPFLSALGIGNLHYKQDGKAYYVFVSGGFAEVSHNQVTILAEVAEKATEIDVDRAMKAKERAQERAAAAKEKIEAARNQAALKRAITRINCKSSGKGAGTC